MLDCGCFLARLLGREVGVLPIEFTGASISKIRRRWKMMLLVCCALWTTHTGGPSLSGRRVFCCQKPRLQLVSRSGRPEVWTLRSNDERLSLDEGIVADGGIEYILSLSQLVSGPARLAFPMAFAGALVKMALLAWMLDV